MTVSTNRHKCKCHPPIYIDRLTDVPFTAICYKCKGWRLIPKEEMPK